MSEQQGTPGRYARTTQGLVASMIVTVVAVLLIVLFLQLDNGAAEQGPAAVDYREAADAATDAGIQVVYPPQLPEGWIATSVDFQPGSRPRWGIGTLTADGGFAGVRQEDDDLDDLLSTYVDDEAERGPDLQVDSPVAPRWRTYTDSGGDTAYAAQVTLGGEQQVVLVYGSAGPDDLQTLLSSLVVG